MRDSSSSSVASAPKQASFLVGKVLCPDVDEVLRSIGPNVRVRGRVLYYSDDGDRRDGFAIMDVDGMHMPMIVPVDCLQYEAEAGCANASANSSDVKSRMEATAKPE